MIQGELLRTKSAHAAAEQRRERIALAHAHARDARARERARGHEDRFWREVARAATTPITDGGFPQSTRASALLRVREACDVVCKARYEQRATSRELQGQISKVLKASSMASAFEKMVGKERFAQARALAERRGEEVEELAVSRRAANVLRRVDREQRDDVRPRQEPVERSVAAQCGIQSHHSATGSHIAPQEPQAVPERGEEGSRRDPVSSLSALSILQRVEVEAAQGSPAAVRMSTEDEGISASCRLEAKTNGAVGIVVESSHQTLVTLMDREQRRIMQRFSELGINVTGFEVRRDFTMVGALSGFLRRSRRAREELDENVIP